MSNNSYSIEKLFDFLQCSPTAFHAARTGATLLLEHGFRQLREQDSWTDLGPGRYFVLRNNSSLIAFTLTGTPLAESGLRMAGAHTDSPGLKLKPNTLYSTAGWLQLGVEVYGGALLAPWFDRDLSLAGRVVVQGEHGRLDEILLDFQHPVAVVPSLAIHFDREANKNKTINAQNDLAPVCSLLPSGDVPADFKLLLAEQIRLEYPDLVFHKILSWELFLYDTQPPALVGFNREFICAGRLDNLLSCHVLLKALLDVERPDNSLLVLNDHEEVGSLSTSGAQGNFLQTVLERLLPDTGQRGRCLSRSLFISTDNAHAAHPNFSDRHDKRHFPLCNQGIVIKTNASQRYATSAVTAGFFQNLCEEAGVPVQQFVMRSDLACGSTIGPLIAGSVGIRTVDVGLPTLAMHSIRELAGSEDPGYLHRALQLYFSMPTAHPLWQSFSS